MLIIFIKISLTHTLSPTLTCMASRRVLHSVYAKLLGIVLVCVSNVLSLSLSLTLRETSHTDTTHTYTIYTRAHVRTRTQIPTYAHTLTQIPTHAHTHTHTHKRTRTHTRYVDVAAWFCSFLHTTSIILHAARNISSKCSVVPVRRHSKYAKRVEYPKLRKMRGRVSERESE